MSSESRKKGLLRLRHLDEVTEAKGEEIKEQAARFERLADPASRPRVFCSFNLFPTPPEIAAEVIALARIVPGMSVLEPSAGLGNLALPARLAGGLVECVEISAELAERLFRADFVVECCDFLELPVPAAGMLREAGRLRFLDERFERVVMNPPFRRGADIKHVRHAIDFLKPGGRLVSVVANGPKQRNALMPIASDWIELPEGSFKSEGTQVNTAIFVHDREE